MTDTDNQPIIPALVANNAGLALQKLLTFACLLLAIALAASAFFFWKQLQLQNSQLMDFQRQVESDERAQDKLLQEFHVNQQAQKTFIDEQLALFETKIEKLNNADRSDWLLAEAEYLLRLANQYATLAHDARSAEVLLANADQAMLELEKNRAASKAIVNIRSQIARERAALKLRNELDREGLYLRLESLIRQTDAITVVDVTSMAKKDQALEESTIPADAPASKRIWTSFAHALEKIGGYIRIQRHDQELGPLLSPDEQQYLKQNLHFRLEQAQIALLQQRQVVYENSLGNARQWIKQYYVIDPALKHDLLAELDTYAKYNIEEALPDISGSLIALKNYMQTRQTK